MIGTRQRVSLRLQRRGKLTSNPKVANFAAATTGTPEVFHTMSDNKHGKSGQYVYSMNRVSKVVPPKREILKDISLSFFPGAKIGVLGLNGAGKSSFILH